MPLPHPSGPLAGYRVVDFADEKGQLCARVLGELGADVIKVEPREGDPARSKGPYYKNDENPELSLWWWTLNAGKRAVTCELRLEAGRELARKLVAEADVVIETWAPGKAPDGFDYASLEKLNPGLIHVSITNFGQTGPYKDWAATDIVGSAMGGHMHLNGDPEHGPVRTTAPQAIAQVNVQAAVGAMVALYARGVNGGAGQHVDVSMQEAMTNAMDHAQATWDIRHVNGWGPGIYRSSSSQPGAVEHQVGAQYLFETADGWLTALQSGGLVGPTANSVIDWMAEAAEARGLDTREWREKLSSLAPPPSPDDRAHAEKVLQDFLRKRPKVALVEEAQRRNLGWAPVFSPCDIVESRHLAERDYWVRVQHEDLGESFLYPGAPWKLSETPWMQRGRAPHLGEHNAEVYGELGVSEPELRKLKLRMVL
jgi:crotonobetainyl-CoA:carnitine CoA-transferase CaiB-like acyl-CoA transferase